MENKKKYYSLRWQITLYILIGTFLFSTISLVITYRYVNRLLTESLIEQGRIVAENIAEMAAEKLIENDVVALRNIVEKNKYYSNIEYILIEDFNKTIKTDTYNGNVPPELLNVPDQSTVPEKNFVVRQVKLNSPHIQIYDILLPVKEGLLGFVRVGMRKSYVEERIHETIFYLGMVFVIGTFLAIILAIIIITFQINRPIVYLTEMAYKISMGDFQKPVVVRVKNEIGVLGEAIERMRESLKTSIERLRNR